MSNYTPYAPRLPLGELIYLGAPYTHKDPLVIEERMRRVNRVAAKLFLTYGQVFSPLTHCHILAQLEKMPIEWDFWKNYDEIMMSRCNALYILMLDGWEDSVGIKGEIELAKKFNIPIFYINEDLVIQSITVCEHLRG